MFFPILFFISSTSLEQQCSERQKYELAKAAEKCFTKFFSQIDLSNACTQTNCETNLSKCHSPDYVGSMRKYFHEKAIYYKYWLILSKKLLGDPLSESVFYFFSPFLLQYCSEVGRITSGQEYFNECMHVKVRSECLLKFDRTPLRKSYETIHLSLRRSGKKDNLLWLVGAGWAWRSPPWGQRCPRPSSRPQDIWARPLQSANFAEIFMNVPLLERQQANMFLWGQNRQQLNIAPFFP